MALMGLLMGGLGGQNERSGDRWREARKLCKSSDTQYRHVPQGSKIVRDTSGVVEAEACWPFLIGSEPISFRIYSIPDRGIVLATARQLPHELDHIDVLYRPSQQVLIDIASSELFIAEITS